MANINLSDYYNKIEIGDTDNGLPTLSLNTYKNGIGTLPTYRYNIEYLNTQFELKATSLNTYTKKRDR